ncbi:hypothetical protein GECvBGOT_gp037c [Salmonella phage GEC_vB_GOT]|nr:hypothetical protein GECvBGOT_gp037c [Salmonella phage GEC_vB_GOT]
MDKRLSSYPKIIPSFYFGVGVYSSPRKNRRVSTFR